MSHMQKPSSVGGSNSSYRSLISPRVKLHHKVNFNYKCMDCGVIFKGLSFILDKTCGFCKSKNIIVIE